MKKTIVAGTIAFCSLSLFSGSAHSASVRVTFENLTTGSVFTPLSSIFHDGTFDNFDLGSSAPVEIQWIAELGNASVLNNKAINEGFAAQALGGSPIFAGNTVSGIFNLDSVQNRYFNFASMFVPSNDAFIGNPNQTEYEIFDINGNFLAQTIDIPANEIWDAGTEINDETSPNVIIPGQAITAQLSPVGGIAENGVVEIHPGYISGGNLEGLGYISPTSLNSPAARITITSVSTPEPENILSLFILVGLGLMLKKKN